MANMSTTRLVDTIEWAKKFNFNRSSVLGNSLEPAKTSANIIKQTILSPPFSWWWNNENATFTTNPVDDAATLTTTALTSDIATYTTALAHGFAVSQLVTVINSSHNSAFNVYNAIILTVPTTTTFTVSIIHVNIVSGADVGTATVSNQDYNLNLPQFGYFDWASIYDTTMTPPLWKEMENKEVLSLDVIPGRPGYINAQNQNSDTGDIVFRLIPSPDGDFPVTINFQKAPVLFTSMNSTWSPIPDYMQHVYSWGFLALMWMFADDPRWTMANQKFIANLLGTSQGLTETERNIFLNNWNTMTSGQQIAQQQGYQGRGV